MTGIGLAQQKPKTAPALLRPRQVEQSKEEVRRIDEMLSQPQHVLQNVDVPAAMRQRTALKRQLDELSPQPIPEKERDEAVRRCGELEGEIRQGMCTAAEMRRNPAGAVDKHRAWERRAKPKINEWKNTRLRMHASGMLGEHVPADATDIANVETLRPVGGSGEMNMDSCQITPTAYYIPPTLASTNHMDDADRQRVNEETADLLAEQAAKGDARHKVALINMVGEEDAKARIKAKLAAPSKKG